MKRLVAAASAVAVLSVGCQDEPRKLERVVPAVEKKKTSDPSPTPEPKKKAEPRSPDPVKPDPARTQASGSEGSASAVIAYIHEVFGAAGPKAVAVADCESDLNPTAIGALGEIGVFQLRPEFHAWRAAAVGGSSLHDWRTNVRAAHHLFKEKGWQPWSCA